MRFRRLTIAELEPLATEFVNFLASNGISGADWAQIKANDPTRTNDLTDAFSDRVMLRVLQQINTVELRTAAEWFLFRYDPHEVFLIKILSKDPVATNLLEIPFKELFSNEAHVANLYFLDSKKAYTKGAREDELFLLLNGGALIGDNDLFDMLWQSFGLGMCRI